jgi:TolA-binding protein
VFAPEFAILIQKLCKQLVSDKKDLQKQLNKAHSKIKTLKEQLERQIMKLRQKQREDDEYANDLREKLDHTERELDQRKIECDGHAGKLIACRSGDACCGKLGPDRAKMRPILPLLLPQPSRRPGQRYRQNSFGLKQSHGNKHKAVRSRVIKDVLGVERSRKQSIHA